jgi:hypothetical protein
MHRTLLPFFFASTLPLLANDTSLHDGRFGPEPLNGVESPVAMVAEHIEVGFGYRDTEVHCTFTFRNTLADRPVEQLVGFPDIGAAVDFLARDEKPDDYSVREDVNTSPIRKMRTFVDGRRVRSELKIVAAKPDHNPDGTAVWSLDKRRGFRAWHTVRVSFPAGKNVTIERIYTVQNGTSALGVAFFHYTTATGAVWQGKIGRLQADVTLRDGLTVDQLIWPGMKPAADRLSGEDAKYATNPTRKSWQALDAKHLRLVWTDFEPRTEKSHRGFSLSRRFHGWN